MIKINLTKKISVAVLAAALFTTGASGNVTVDLPYPSGKLSNANEIMKNVYFVKSFFRI